MIIFALYGSKANKKKIKGLLSKEKTIVIIPHKNPDGDAIGSSTALDSYLKKLGHKSLIICPNHFPKFLNWMDPKKKLKSLKRIMN